MKKYQNMPKIHFQQSNCNSIFVCEDHALNSLDSNAQACGSDVLEFATALLTAESIVAALA